MSTTMMVFIGLVVFAVVAVLSVISIYNGLVRLRNQFKNAFSQIDVQLNRRYDLIPNLVETAKGYMKHESETLEKVIQARNQAYAISQKMGDNPVDPDMMAKLLSSEAALGKSMMNFMALAENYPDLKANQNMQQLMEELTSTENKIAFARQAYNDSVMEYNTAREVFPSNVFAGMFNFQAATTFQVEDEAARKSVKVSF
jgi:LemA protein